MEGNADDLVSVSRSEAIELLGFYYTLAPPRWQNLQSVVNVFVTVTLALLAATVGALDKFSQWPVNLVLVAAPMTAFVIGHLAKSTIRKQDRHIRELIVVIGHLEEFIGLTLSPPGGSSRRFWPGDVAFLPKRWTVDRSTDRLSDDFVERRRLGGTAGAAHKMFSFIQGLSIFLALAIVLIPALR